MYPGWKRLCRHTVIGVHTQWEHGLRGNNNLQFAAGVTVKHWQASAAFPSSFAETAGWTEIW